MRHGPYVPLDIHKSPATSMDTCNLWFSHFGKFHLCLWSQRKDLFPWSRPGISSQWYAPFLVPLLSHSRSLCGSNKSIIHMLVSSFLSFYSNDIYSALILLLSWLFSSPPTFDCSSHSLHNMFLCQTMRNKMEGDNSRVKLPSSIPRFGFLDTYFWSPSQNWSYLWSWQIYWKITYSFSNSKRM